MKFPKLRLRPEIKQIWKNPKELYFYVITLQSGAIVGCYKLLKLIPVFQVSFEPARLIAISILLVILIDLILFQVPCIRYKFILYEGENEFPSFVTDR